MTCTYFSCVAGSSEGECCIYTHTYIYTFDCVLALIHIDTDVFVVFRAGSCVAHPMSLSARI